MPAQFPQRRRTYCVAGVDEGPTVLHIDVEASALLDKWACGNAEGHAGAVYDGKARNDDGKNIACSVEDEVKCTMVGVCPSRAVP